MDKHRGCRPLSLGQQSTRLAGLLLCAGSIYSYSVRRPPGCGRDMETACAQLGGTSQQPGSCRGVAFTHPVVCSEMKSREVRSGAKKHPPTGGSCSVPQPRAARSFSPYTSAPSAGQWPATWLTAFSVWRQFARREAIAVALRRVTVIALTVIQLLPSGIQGLRHGSLACPYKTVHTR